MKKFKCLLTAMLLACSTASFAQFTNGGGGAGASSDVEAWKGLRFSYDRTFVNTDFSTGSFEPDMNGFSFGYVQSFKIAKKVPIFFETGLGLNFARNSNEFTDDYGNGAYETYKYNQTVLGLNIPLNVVYGVKINDMLAIKPYTGFYLRINVMAKEKDTYEWNDGAGDSGSEDKSYNMFDKDDVLASNLFYAKKWSRCQFGWQIGATLDINQFNVGIGYALDFNEIAEKTKTSKFAVTVGYNF